jgi:hypothetical protein
LCVFPKISYPQEKDNKISKGGKGIGYWDTVH